MRCSEILRRRAEPIWSKVLDHPFVLELYSGRLPLSKFRYYVIQDFNYLVTMVKVFSIVAAKAPDINHAKIALELAYGTVTEEMANYVRLLSELGLTVEDVLRVQPNPTNVAYMNFLIATAYSSDYWTLMATLLPCFWSYEEIAERHKEKLDQNPVGVYRKWASVYLSEPYKKIVKDLRDAVDSLSIDSECLWPGFELATKYEYMFWTAAYSEEVWPI
ncbi:MAG: thiaminase II [Nitrososphaerota archaeon]